MPAQKRERPTVKGKDAENFLKKVRENNKKMKERIEKLKKQ